MYKKKQNNVKIPFLIQYRRGTGTVPSFRKLCLIILYRAVMWIRNDLFRIITTQHSAEVSLPELGSRQQYRDNVTLFSGRKIVGYSIIPGTGT